MKLDLNCDLGEGESRSRTRALMRWITSANVACGGHAGDLETMDACVRLAKRFGVRVGAHPGTWSRNDFGRARVELVPDALELLLLQQVGALERILRRHREKLHHIKLHGALYHASEEKEGLGRRYVEAVSRWWPGCIVYVRADGHVAKLARGAGLRAWREAFADRAYLDDGSLVPRGESNALFTDTAAVRRRVQRLQQCGEVETISGRSLRLHPQTVCLHSDTPNVFRLARAVACLLELRR
jgi:5-oxoprolinase (ATP-hydrolysing) subunit A